MTATIMATRFPKTLARPPPKVKYNLLVQKSALAFCGNRRRELDHPGGVARAGRPKFIIGLSAGNVKEGPIMNVTPRHKQIQALKALVEGNSIRSIERMTGIHRDTVMRLLVNVGEECQKKMNKFLRGFHCHQIQVDEIWTFVRKKEKRLTPLEKLNRNLGDQYVFVALDPDTKLIPTFAVGKRDGTTALKFMLDLHNRLNGNGRIQLTTDGFTAYLEAVEEAFGANIDFAQLIKIFASDYIGPGRYSPPHITEVLSKIINGNPNPRLISTSYIERQNLTMRMQMRRFTRLTNGFSKKIENLKAALSLHFAHYNFIRVHTTLRVTPAMQASITDHIWEWGELLPLN